MPFPFLALLLSALCFLSGCAEKVEPLNLQNVLDYKAQRAAAREEKEASIEPPTSPIPANTAAASVRSPSTLFSPAELNELQLPQDFLLVAAADLKKPEFADKAAKLFSEAAAGWKKRDADLLVLVSKTALNSERLETLTKKDFLAEIDRTAKQFDLHYQKTYKVPALAEVKEIKGLIVLKVTSKYPENGVWRTDLRYIYFYNPEYRLNLLVTGNDEELARTWEGLESSFKPFTSVLSSSRFAREIPFQKDPGEI